MPTGSCSGKSYASRRSESGKPMRRRSALFQRLQDLGDDDGDESIVIPTEVSESAACIVSSFMGSFELHKSGSDLFESPPAAPAAADFPQVLPRLHRRGCVSACCLARPLRLRNSAKDGGKQGARKLSQAEVLHRDEHRLRLMEAAAGVAHAGAPESGKLQCSDA